MVLFLLKTISFLKEGFINSDYASLIYQADTFEVVMLVPFDRLKSETVRSKAYYIKSILLGKRLLRI